MENLTLRPNLLAELGAKKWIKGDICNYYFSEFTVRYIGKKMGIPESLLEKHKERMLFDKVYYDGKKIRYKSISGDKDIQETAAFIENYILNEVEGLNDSNSYVDGVLRELIDDDD